MANRKPAVAKEAKSPEKPTRLTTLTEGQAALVSAAVARLESAKQAAQEAQRELNALLSMSAPVGANGFDFDTMTYLSVPKGKPEGEPKE